MTLPFVVAFWWRCLRWPQSGKASARNRLAGMGGQLLIRVRVATLRGMTASLIRSVRPRIHPPP